MQEFLQRIKRITRIESRSSYNELNELHELSAPYVRSLRFDFFDMVRVNVPEVAMDVRGGCHGGEEVHVAADLVVVLGLGGTELEVDDDPFTAVGYHTVGTMLTDLTVFNGEDGTLVEECPTL